jgi:hypothetical protein
MKRRNSSVLISGRADDGHQGVHVVLLGRGLDQLELEPIGAPQDRGAHARLGQVELLLGLGQSERLPVERALGVEVGDGEADAPASARS